MRLHAVCFLFFVFFSFLHSAFVWHVVDILTSQPVHFLFYRFCLFLSHFMCQNESRAYSLLNSNIPTVTNSSQERSLSLHMALNISELFGFSFVFWLQGRPTVSFVLLRCRRNTHRGKLSAVKWVQYHSRYWSRYLNRTKMTQRSRSSVSKKWVEASWKHWRASAHNSSKDFSFQFLCPSSNWKIPCTVANLWTK